MYSRITTYFILLWLVYFLLVRGAYSNLSVNVVVLMFGLALITRNTVFVFLFFVSFFVSA